MNLAKLLPFLIVLILFSCGTRHENAEEEKVQSVTPVTVTSVSVGTLVDTVELNATSSFLLKTNVKAPVNGYIQQVKVKLGDKVSSGQELFAVRSKEANSLGNMLNKMDTSFHFRGVTIIKAPANGFITQLGYQQGDYVQDGESLANISDQNSLAFLLDLPFEFTPFLANNKHVKIRLSDGRIIRGTISSSLPYVDAASQTQSFIIRMDQYQTIPENLIALVSFVRKAKTNAVSLPKEAVLTDEQQTEFWIMKMIDNNTAVKVPIQKGIETTSRIEIVSPALKPQDKILLSGNYGLPDTAKVKIESKE